MTFKLHCTLSFILIHCVTHIGFEKRKLQTDCYGCFIQSKSQSSSMSISWVPIKKRRVPKMRRNIKNLKLKDNDLQSESELLDLKYSSSCLVVFQKSFNAFSCLNLKKQTLKFHSNFSGITLRTGEMHWGKFSSFLFLFFQICLVHLLDAECLIDLQKLISYY